MLEIISERGEIFQVIFSYFSKNVHPMQGVFNTGVSKVLSFSGILPLHVKIQGEDIIKNEN